jgi:hypothetical protein
VQSAAGTGSDGWDITYNIPTGSPVTRVSTITTLELREELDAGPGSGFT